MGAPYARRVVGLVQAERKSEDMAFIIDELNRSKTAVRTYRLLGVKKWKNGMI